VPETHISVGRPPHAHVLPNRTSRRGSAASAATRSQPLETPCPRHHELAFNKSADSVTSVSTETDPAWISYPLPSPIPKPCPVTSYELLHRSERTRTEAATLELSDVAGHDWTKDSRMSAVDDAARLATRHPWCRKHLWRLTTTDLCPLVIASLRGSAVRQSPASRRASPAPHRHRPPPRFHAP